MLLKLVS